MPIGKFKQSLVDFVCGTYISWLRATPAPPTTWGEHIEQIAEFAAGADALATLLGAVKGLKVTREDVQQIAARFILDERIVDYGLRAVRRLSPKLSRSDQERLMQVRSRLTTEDLKIGQVGTDVTMALFDLPAELRAGLARTSIRGQQTLMAFSVFAGGLGSLVNQMSSMAEAGSNSDRARSSGLERQGSSSPRRPQPRKTSD